MGVAGVGKGTEGYEKDYTHKSDLYIRVNKERQDLASIWGLIFIEFIFLVYILGYVEGCYLSGGGYTR